MSLTFFVFSCVAIRPWSPNLLLVGTLPKTSQSEEIIPKTAARSSMAMQTISLTLYIPLTLTKRKSFNSVQFASLL